MLCKQFEKKVRSRLGQNVANNNSKRTLTSNIWQAQKGEFADLHKNAANNANILFVYARIANFLWN